MSIRKYIPPWLWLVLVAVYILSPIDLFPDFLGLPGRVDDILMALVGLYYYYASPQRKTRKGGTTGPEGWRSGGRQEKRESSGGRETAGREKESADPYEVLDLKRGTPLSEIRDRYKEKMLHYHPDRVQHLGSELQELAEKKTKELNEAYQKILKDFGEKP